MVDTGQRSGSEGEARGSGGPFTYTANSRPSGQMLLFVVFSVTFLPLTVSVCANSAQWDPVAGVITTPLHWSGSGRVCQTTFPGRIVPNCPVGPERSQHPTRRHVDSGISQKLCCFGTSLEQSPSIKRGSVPSAFAPNSRGFASAGQRLSRMRALPRECTPSSGKFSAGERRATGRWSFAV
jgi:hypothetical protein